jgi:hypothetical protein
MYCYLNCEIAVAQLIEALRQKTGVFCFDSRCGASKFSSDLILLSAFSSTGVYSASTEINAKEFPWGKVRLANTADSSAVTVVPNVRKGRKCNIPPPLSPVYMTGKL